MKSTISTAARQGAWSPQGYDAMKVGTKRSEIKALNTLLQFIKGAISKAALFPPQGYVRMEVEYYVNWKTLSSPALQPIK